MNGNISKHLSILSMRFRQLLWVEGSIANITLNSLYEIRMPFFVIRVLRDPLNSLYEIQIPIELGLKSAYRTLSILSMRFR